MQFCEKYDTRSLNFIKLMKLHESMRDRHMIKTAMAKHKFVLSSLDPLPIRSKPYLADLQQRKLEREAVVEMKKVGLDELVVAKCASHKICLPKKIWRPSELRQISPIECCHKAG